ncbi:hypothetical protein [Stenotrophomonas sp. NA06056]|uniref:hypothetical protein n=1 Tax=Stenotrophomonas sp. NA06056 TaxID=2742129 RepID=UPI0015897E34|nr:hypothetical protein [Stenotrophomonas sp. NA06056]QKW57677.1 hypothetical protein HUT07_14115 [Stenotrophomonas sp. NA06056]
MMPFRIAAVALLLILGGCGDAGSGGGQHEAPTAAPPGLPATMTRTPHFVIHSAATPEQTAAVGMAAEALHRSYAMTV